MSQQIFISYARADNAPPPDLPNAKGFITALEEQLRFEFGTHGEPKPKLWWDKKRIEDGQQFGPEIEAALADSAILLVVLSRNWLASKNCADELKGFARRWRTDGEERVRHRIVVVHKHHVDSDKRPSLLQGQVGYKFFALDDAAEAGMEQHFFARGEIRDPRYQVQIEALGKYLWRKAQRVTEEADAGDKIALPVEEAAVQPNGRTIYVAKPAEDMRKDYARIVKELTGRGFTVVPEPSDELPRDCSAGGAIDEALEAAELSVHLLGDGHGFAPDEHDRIVPLQLMRAAARAGRPATRPDQPEFRRIIWAPKIMQEIVGASERDPLAVLAKFHQQLPGDKIEGDSISKFVDFLSKHLVRAAPTPPPPPEFKANRRVYLNHSPEDTEFVFSLAEALQDREIETVLPVFEGPDAEVKSFHRKNLAECDAIALCWANAPEVWVRSRASELRDWHELGRAAQFVYRGVVAGPPPGTRKKGGRHLFPKSEIDRVVDLTSAEQVTPEMLDPLVPGGGQSAQ